MIIYITPENQVLEPVVRDGRNHFVCVFLSPVVSEEVQNLRCLSCGWVVAQYTNKQIEAIVYGIAKPKEQNSVDIQCSRCKLLYRVI